MFKVSIEEDAHYKKGEDNQYREICTKCGANKIENTTTCSCGHPFPKKESGFFKSNFSPPKIELKFPQVCPKTLRQVSKEVKFSSKRITGATPWLHKEKRLTFSVPVSRKIIHPGLLKFLIFTFSILFTVFLIMFLYSLTQIRGPLLAKIMNGAICIFSLIDLIWARREYSWFRLAFFNHRALIFKIRQLKYAQALAAENQGCIK